MKKYNKTINDSYNKIEQLQQKELFNVDTLKSIAISLIQINQEFNKLNL